MPNHLNKKQLSELSDMLKSGKTNAEVAEYFKVSVATVNNHRTRMKREGMSFPSKRGRRPKEKAVNIVKEKSVVKESQKISTKVKMENYIFIINGVVVTVSGKAKNVHIGQDSMEVNF
jgi:transposase